MKKRRQSKIIELITNFDIETQNELQDKLIESGFDVTQATISRDIKELRLTKSLTVNGRYCYSKAQTVVKDINISTTGMFTDAIVDVKYSINIVCIKCFPGLANAVCTSIDSLSLNDVVGTIAGDDTIFVLCTSEQTAENFSINLRTILNA